MLSFYQVMLSSAVVFITALAVVINKTSSELLKYASDGDTLVLAHVVFRHGDRTPDAATIYPTDPYINETYFPYGVGKLTIDGKSRAYALGVSLHKRYGNYLGDVYYDDLVESISSGSPRAIATLQSVQAGLFPPSDQFKLHKDLHWQPIPFSFTNTKEDKLIATVTSCRKVLSILNDLESTPKFHKAVQKYKNLLPYLSKHTGWQVNNTRWLFFVHNALKSEEEWGFKLPEWTEGIYPEPLRTAAANFWKILANTVETRRILAGNLLKKIVDDSVKKSNSNLHPETRKLFLYSGHDMNIVILLAAMGHYDDAVPYTGHLIFELHRINGVYGFKIFYGNYKGEQPKHIVVKGCKSFCPIEKFIELMEENFPGENWCPN